MADTHKTYSTEFKLKAIKLAGQPGHTASSAARDLGVEPYLIHRWMRQQAKTNAPTESFFATLKTELELDKARGNRAQTRSLVFEWLEVFYNRERRHSSLGYLSPDQFEEQHSRLD